MPVQLRPKAQLAHNALLDSIFRKGIAYEKKLAKDTPIPDYMEATHRQYKDSNVYNAGREEYRQNPSTRAAHYKSEEDKESAIEERKKDQENIDRLIREHEERKALPTSHPAGSSAASVEPRVRKVVKIKKPAASVEPIAPAEPIEPAEPRVRKVIKTKKPKAPTNEMVKTPVQQDTEDDYSKYESGKPKRDVDTPIAKAKLMKMVPTAYQAAAQPGGSEPTPSLSQNLFLERQRDYTRRQVGPLGTNKKLDNFIVEKPLHPSPLDYYESAMIRKQNLQRLRSAENRKPFMGLNPFSNG